MENPANMTYVAGCSTSIQLGTKTSGAACATVSPAQAPISGPSNSRVADSVLLQAERNRVVADPLRLKVHPLADRNMQVGLEVLLVEARQGVGVGLEMSLGLLDHLARRQADKEGLLLTLHELDLGHIVRNRDADIGVIALLAELRDRPRTLLGALRPRLHQVAPLHIIPVRNPHPFK